MNLHAVLRADQIALIASRVMSLAVAGMSLLVAVFGTMKLALPALEAWSQGKELLFGATVVPMIAGSYALAVRLARTSFVASAAD